MFIKIFFGLSIALLVSVGALNYAEDPGKIFGEKHPFEQKLVEVAAAGRNALVDGNLDERTFKRLLIGKIKNRPDVVIVGSSRAMQINSENLARPAINLAVSSASMEDEIALAALAMRKFGRKEIIYVVDPWLFHADLGWKRWMALQDVYYPFVSSELHISVSHTEETFDEKLQRYRQLINFDYTLASLKELSKSNAPAATVPSTTDSRPAPESDLIRADGGYTYSAKFIGRPQFEVDAEAAKFHKPHVFGMGAFEFSDEKWRLFQAFVSYMQANSSKLTVVFAPYHPIAFHNILNVRPEVPEIEKRIRFFAAASNISVVGSYDPAKVGCPSTEFFDGMHPREACLGRFIR